VVEDIEPLLCRYPWPGNVRELENVTERLAVFLSSCATASAIDHDELRLTLAELYAPPEDDGATSRAALTDQAIRAALAAAKGNRHAAAQRLNISRTTLWRRLRTMG
jgi:propionate catabolism operon transcriptional regulator